MSSSGAKEGSTQYNWNDVMGGYWAGSPSWPGGVLQRGIDASMGKPYERYGGYTTGVDGQTPASSRAGGRVADMTPAQFQAMQHISDFVGGSGSPVTRSANGQLQQTLDDKYLSGDKRNPWGGAEVQAFRNQYSGNNNPYFGDALKTGREDIAQGYNLGASADTNRMFDLSGAFGGSAHQQAMANNQAGLGKALSNFETGMQNDQYNRSAQLEDTFQNRNLQSQTTNKQIGSQNFENERNRQMGAVSGGQNEQALALQRYNALMGIGDAQQQQNQQYLNQDFNDWAQKQGWDRSQIDWMSGLLSKAQGGIGGSSTQTPAQYGVNPISALMGGLMGYKALS